jgi:predicted house-cleaning noncanonical NTP pyrophosphatase (MazG superfamily)
MQEFRKLVRDKIPDIIRQQGETPRIEILSDDAYLTELDKKLFEEMEEYQGSKEPEELADILEVIYAICTARGYSVDELYKMREEKLNKRGGFSKKIFLVSKE